MDTLWLNSLQYNTVIMNVFVLYDRVNDWGFIYYLFHCRELSPSFDEIKNIQLDLYIWKLKGDIKLRFVYMEQRLQSLKHAFNFEVFYLLYMLTYSLNKRFCYLLSNNTDCVFGRMCVLGTEASTLPFKE